MGIRAHQRVGIVDAIFLHDAASQVLQVDLMNNADARRHDTEAVEGLHPPLEELISLPVALELDLHVHIQRVGAVREIDLNGMVDDEIDRDERLDDLRLAP